MFFDALVDACFDTLKLIPFLFVTYLFMEWLEHGAGKRIEGAIARGGRIGPLFGSVLGIVPQCGFSGAAATLYAGRVITLGTLVSVFLVTSDEMLPIMISQAVDPLLIVKILAAKLVIGLVSGFAIDTVLVRTGRLHAGLASKRLHAGHHGHDIHALCEEEGCACCDHDCPEHGDAAQALAADAGAAADGEGDACGHEHVRGHEHGVVLPALKHTLNVSVFIFIITLLLNLVVEMGFDEALAGSATAPYLGTLVAGVFGFIPNCAVSVGLTQLYLDGVLGGGALLSGLTVNAGIGLVVLFRTNRDFNENLRIMLVMLAIGIVAGMLAQAFCLF